MSSEEQRLKAVSDNLKLIEHHLTLHWIQSQQKPTQTEIETFCQELRKAVKELEDIQKMFKVFHGHH